MLFEPKLQNPCFINPIRTIQPRGRRFGMVSKCQGLFKTAARWQEFERGFARSPAFPPPRPAAEGNQPWLSAGQQGPPAEPVFSLPCLKDTFACVTSVWAFWLLTH